MNTILHERTLPLGQTLQIVQGDLTQEHVGAIVNAANSQLQHGGGVAAAIVRSGGAQIQAESNAWIKQHGPVSHSKPAYTRSGTLPCRYVIHAVGPVWGEGDEDRKLAAAVSNSLQLADQLELISIALPAISTGIYGFPKGRAAQIIIDSIRAYFEAQPESGLRQVRLTLYDQATIDAFLQVWETMGLES